MTRHLPPERRRSALVVRALALTGSSLVVMGSVAGVSESRAARSTPDDGALSSVATVDVRLDPSATSAATMLLMETDGLIPGVVADRCVVVRYRGSVDDVDLRLSAQRDPGARAPEDLQVTIEMGEGTDPSCHDFVPQRALHASRLGMLWTDHATFDDGLTVLPRARRGDQATVRFSVVLERAPTRASDPTFWFLFETRA